MNTSTATADTPLRQAWLWCICGQAGRLAWRLDGFVTNRHE